MARRIARVNVEAKLDISEDVYVDQFKPSLIDVVHAWCKGASFLQLCKMTTIFEGNDIALCNCV
jgi:ATP-dependent RNA helicase DOB1